MRRRVIQIANSTQLVSLPRKWALKYGIKKGDELVIEEKENHLVVSTNSDVELIKIEVDISNLDRVSIIFCIQSLYRLGYDEIKIIFKNAITKSFRENKEENVLSIIHYIVNRLTGFEIIQQKGNSCVIMDIQGIKGKEFDNVLKRIFLLWKDAYRDFVEGIRENKHELLESIEEKHDSITKFVSYCLRIINKSGYPQSNKSHIVYHIISNIDKTMDVIKHASRDILKGNITLPKEGINILDIICNSIELYYQNYYNFDMKKVNEISNNRTDVKNSIKKIAHKLNDSQIIVLEDMRSTMELLMDLIEARWGLQY